MVGGKLSLAPVECFRGRIEQRVVASSRNATFLPKVGETGVGEMGVGEQVPIRLYCQSWIYNVTSCKTRMSQICDIGPLRVKGQL